MKIVGLCPARNEDWVLALSARVALMWCDELIILVHASEDRTAAIASELSCEFPGRVWVSFEQDPNWDEMTHRERLLQGARQRGATHIAIVDADEILTGNLLPSIRTYVETLPAGHILQLPGYNLRGSIDRYHSNGIWGNRMFSMVFRDQPSASWRGDQFHHREPFGMPNIPCQPVRQGQGGVMHLWGANERRLIAKHASYKVTELVRWPYKPIREIDRMYNLAIHASASNGTRFAVRDWEYADVPTAWWEPYADLMHHLNLTEVPWQEAAVRAIVAEHGREKFAGLDLYGVV